MSCMDAKSIQLEPVTQLRLIREPCPRHPRNLQTGRLALIVHCWDQTQKGSSRSRPNSLRSACRSLRLLPLADDRAHAIQYCRKAAPRQGDPESFLMDQNIWHPALFRCAVEFFVSGERGDIARIVSQLTSCSVGGLVGTVLGRVALVY